MEIMTGQSRQDGNISRNELVEELSDPVEEKGECGPSRARIAKGLAAEYHKSEDSGVGAFAEVCHRWTYERKEEISYIQKSMEMIDDTYFEYLNLGHEEFMKKYYMKR